MSKIRDFFKQKNVLEVETPILSSAGNTDININSFETFAINNDFSKSYLRTSPEFPLKRLLCSGVGDVFELGKVFRTGEISKTHNIEFTMLEWYRIEFNLIDLIDEVKELFSSILSSFDLQQIPAKIVTFNDCFGQYLAIHPQDTKISELNKMCQDFDYAGSQLTRNEALDFLFATQIQVKFDKNILTFVTHYPSSQAALAQINPKDKTTSLRFEVFYQGHELGNGYQELTDGGELQKRFENDNLIRENNNAKIQIDHKLISAMKNGMPKCSGIAMGVDRILMVLLESDSITEVLSFNAENA